MRRALYTLVAVASFLAGMVCSVSLQSLAQIRLEIGLGQAKFHPRENETWRLQRFDTDESAIGSSYLIGLSDTPWSLGRTRLGWRFAFSNLGQFHTRNTAMNRDEDIMNDPSTCNAQTGINCQRRYNTNGGAYGATFGPIVERSVAGFTLGAEAGLFRFKSWSDTEVFCDNDGATVTRGGSFNFNKATGIHNTWYMGVNARRGPIFIAYRNYHNVYEQGENVGWSGHRAWQVLAGVSVPI